jgi:hypothetical protein
MAGVRATIWPPHASASTCNDTANDITKVIVGTSLSRARSLLRALIVAIREQEARLKKAD